MNHKAFFGIVFSVLFTSSTLFAQEETGRIEGRVIRLDDSPISGLSVVINELEITDITDANGLFAFTGVPVGTYTVTLVLGTNLATLSAEVTAGQATLLEERVDWELGFVETMTVYGASKRTERIVESPAAVTVVSEKQIARIASHGQAPKMMEFTPGAEVTQSGLYDFNFNTRGFNSKSRDGLDRPQDRVRLSDLQHRLEVRPRGSGREARGTRDESAPNSGPISRGEGKKKIRLTHYSHKIDVSY